MLQRCCLWGRMVYEGYDECRLRIVPVALEA